MRWSIAIAAAGFMCVLSSPVILAQAFNPVTDADRDQYQAAFGERLHQVRLTRETTDNLALATEMTELADRIPDSPGVRCLIYIDAIPLASDAGNMELAIFAAGRLESLWPNHEAADPVKLLAIAKDAYLSAPFDERTKRAEPYLELVLEVARRAERDNDIERAIQLCRDANPIARKVESDKRQRIEDTLDRLSRISEDLNEIKRLSLAVQKNPQNAQAARDLVQLLVIRRDDAQTAATFAPFTGDLDLVQAVSASARGLEQASAPDALFVADWYMTLADSQDDLNAPKLLAHAMRWYERFQQLYTREDALAQRVALRQSVASARIDRINAAERAARRGQWIDLIATLFKPDLHAVGEGVSLARNEVKLSSAAFVLPVTPEGNYELRVRLTLSEPTEGLSVTLPVGNQSSTVHFAINNNSMSAIHSVDKFDFVPERMNKPGKAIELVYQVAVQPDGRIGLALLVNGQESLKWLGDAASINPDENLLPPEDFRRAPYFVCKGKATFHSIELRERE